MKKIQLNILEDIIKSELSINDAEVIDGEYYATKETIEKIVKYIVENSPKNIANQVLHQAQWYYVNGANRNRIWIGTYRCGVSVYEK